MRRGPRAAGSVDDDDDEDEDAGAGASSRASQETARPRVGRDDTRDGTGAAQRRRATAAARMVAGSRGATGPSRGRGGRTSGDAAASMRATIESPTARHAWRGVRASFVAGRSAVMREASEDVVSWFDLGRSFSFHQSYGEAIGSRRSTDGRENRGRGRASARRANERDEAEDGARGEGRAGRAFGVAFRGHLVYRCSSGEFSSPFLRSSGHQAEKRRDGRRQGARGRPARPTVAASVPEVDRRRPVVASAPTALRLKNSRCALIARAVAGSATTRRPTRRSHFALG